MYRRNKKSLKGEATEDKILVERMFESTERLEWKVEKRDEELITEFSSSTEVEEQVPNNYMTIRTETADVLPECVIRKILCFLSFKEATQMSVVSKTWFRAWLTHFNLKFHISR